MSDIKAQISKLLTSSLTLSQFEFEAAVPMFREIRKTLNDMAVKRSQPIKKVTSMSQVMAINV
jgi:hypothetical protein